MLAILQRALLGRGGAVLAAAVVLAAWLPALDFRFLNYDDNNYVVDNLAIRSFDAAMLAWAFTSQYQSNWNPLSWIAHAADVAVWGFDPFGHHLTSVLLHALNAALVAVLARRLAQAAGLAAVPAGAAALTAALLFGLHPVQVEAVAWIAQRKTLLFAAFALLAALAWTEWHATGRRRWYAAALAAFAGALLSKGVAVTLPLVLLVVGWYPLRRHRTVGWRRLVLEQVPFLALAGAAAVAVMVGNRIGGGLVTQDAVPLATSLAALPHAALHYLRVLVWPAELSPLHPLWAFHRLDDPRTIGAALALLAGAGGLLALARRRPAPAAAVLTLFLGLLPTLGLVRVGVPILAAERYLYLAAAGVFVLAGAGLAFAVGRLRPALVLPAAVLLPLALLPAMRAELAVWRNDATLWARVLEHYPGYPLALVGRGYADLDGQDWASALRHCAEAVQRAPADLLALECRGEALAGLGRHEEAVRDFTAVLRRGGQSITTLASRGLSLLSLGDLARAENDLRIAVRADGTHVPSLYNLALTRSGRGDAEEACTLLRQAQSHGFAGRAQAETEPGFATARAAPCWRQVAAGWR